MTVKAKMTQPSAIRDAQLITKAYGKVILSSPTALLTFARAGRDLQRKQGVYEHCERKHIEMHQ